MKHAMVNWMAVPLLVLSMLGVCAGVVHAAPGTAAAVASAPDEAMNKRMMAIATELRCLVCQNQTVADSHADLAVDLRQQILTLLQEQLLPLLQQSKGEPT